VPVGQILDQGVQLLLAQPFGERRHQGVGILRGRFADDALDRRRVATAADRREIRSALAALSRDLVAARA
jgi:hypothetical protein